MCSGAVPAGSTMSFIGAGSQIVGAFLQPVQAHQGQPAIRGAQTIVHFLPPGLEIFKVISIGRHRSVQENPT